MARIKKRAKYAPRTVVPYENDGFWCCFCPQGPGNGLDAFECDTCGKNWGHISCYGLTHVFQQKNTWKNSLFHCMKCMDHNLQRSKWKTLSMKAEKDNNKSSTKKSKSNTKPKQNNNQIAIASSSNNTNSNIKNKNKQRQNKQKAKSSPTKTNSNKRKKQKRHNNNNNSNNNHNNHNQQQSNTGNQRPVTSLPEQKQQPQTQQNSNSAIHNLQISPLSSDPEPKPIKTKQQEREEFIIENELEGFQIAEEIRKQKLCISHLKSMSEMEIREIASSLTDNKVQFYKFLYAIKTMQKPLDQFKLNTPNTPNDHQLNQLSNHNVTFPSQAFYFHHPSTPFSYPPPHSIPHNPIINHSYLPIHSVNYQFNGRHDPMISDNHIHIDPNTPQQSVAPQPLSSTFADPNTNTNTNTNSAQNQIQPRSFSNNDNSNANVINNSTESADDSIVIPMDQDEVIQQNEAIIRPQAPPLPPPPQRESLAMSNVDWIVEKVIYGNRGKTDMFYKQICNETIFLKYRLDESVRRWDERRRKFADSQCLGFVVKNKLNHNEIFGLLIFEPNKIYKDIMDITIIADWKYYDLMGNVLLNDVLMRVFKEKSNIVGIAASISEKDEYTRNVLKNIGFEFENKKKVIFNERDIGPLGVKNDSNLMKEINPNGQSKFDVVYESWVKMKR